MTDQRPVIALVIVVALIAVVIVAAVFVARPVAVPSASPPAPTSGPTTPVPASPDASPSGEVILAAGDIASCASDGDEATGALLDTMAGTIVILGDIAYESGTTAQFNDCFDRSWGEHKARMKPVPGNHEYETAGAAGYFEYFGSAAGGAGKGYYAWDLGGWRLYGLNSNCAHAGGCSAGSEQETWLRNDLAANPRPCVAAYWHHPRFSSGRHGSADGMEALWQALYDAGADLILAGHDHDYERFGPQTAWGTADAARGIRSFVVGMGGRSHYPFTRAPIANSEARNADTFGLLKVTLGANGFWWQFEPVAGQTYSDSGSAGCH